MEKLALTDKIVYPSFLEMGKEVYLYPGRFYTYFSSAPFLKAIFSDKERYPLYQALKKENPIPDVFLFKMSYILNPYMSLRYHRFIFSSYKELGQTMLSYGPIVDVYLKDLIVYGLLTSYMERMRDDFNYPKIYQAAKKAEKEALQDENKAYWDLAFFLGETKTMTYEGKEYKDPKEFFNSKLVLSDLLAFSSSFLSDRYVLSWLSLNGFQPKVDKFLSLASVNDDKENQAQDELAKELYKKYGPKETA
jgi:hypothetical protein